MRTRTLKVLISFLVIISTLVGTFRVQVSGTQALSTAGAKPDVPTAKFQSSLCATQTDIPEDECTALVDIYNSTNGPAWTYNAGWLVTTTPCSWIRVTCQNGHVSEFILERNNASGTLPTLPSHLTIFYGGSSNLTGNIPDLPSSLQVFSAFGNQLSGNIPTLPSSLEALYINDNQLSGNIPTLPSSLETMDVRNNHLNGVIPRSIINTRLFPHWSDYTGLCGGTNNFYAFDPAVQSFLTTIFDASDLSCVAFEEPPTANAGPDQQVQDSNNTGSVVVTLDGSQSASSDGSGLTYAWSENGAPIASSVSVSVALADGTHTFTLTITDGHGVQMTDSVVIKVDPFIGSCPSQSDIPESECASLLDLYRRTDGSGWFNNSGWTGTDSPCDWYGITCSGGHVSAIALGGNNLVGNISELPPFLTTFVADSNQLSGTLPALPSTLTTIKMNGNQLTGNIPDLPSGLDTFEVSGNQLSGSVPALPSSLTDLRLDNNQLSGLIPSSITTTQIQSNLSLCGGANTFYFVDPAVNTFLSAVLSPSELSCVTLAPVPTVKAGFDQEVVDSNNNGSETVTLDGSLSVSNDGGSLTYSWTENGTEIATGVTPNVSFNVGSHTITLTVTDMTGSQATDTVIVRVDRFVSLCSTQTEIDERECVDLADFYDSTNGPNWNSKSGWMVTTSPCSWYGIVCLDGHVNGILMNLNNLTGPIPALPPELASLEVFQNHLSGPLPPLPSTLYELSIYTNNFTGNIPALPASLGIVNARDNQLSGSIPTLPATLGVLIVANNQLTGSIPALPTLLSGLAVDGNKLSGAIPPSIVSTGIQLPGGLELCGGDNAFYTYDSAVETFLTNIFSDSLPSCVAFEQLPTANAGPDQNVNDKDNNGSESVTLDGSLSSSMIGGSLTYSWSDNGRVIAIGAAPTVQLNVGTHTITLTVTDIHDAQATDMVVVTINKFDICAVQGDLPTSECASLVDLYKGTNGPDWTNHTDWTVTESPCSWYGVGCSDGHVQNLHLDHNNLVGILPALPATLVYLDATGNQLSGPIPDLPTTLTTLFLSDNQLTGSIPTLSQTLEDLWVGNNQLMGAIPDLPSTLHNFAASNNQLTGSIPSLPDGVSDLDVSGNQLTGVIPALPSSLGSFAASDNQLTGSIPTLPASLTYLQLGNNKLSGSLPTLPSSLSNIEVYNNQLSGTLPTLPSSLAFLQVADNQLTGSIPALPSSLTTLVLSGNQLSGTIPALPASVNYLWIANNQLSGEVPASITATQITNPYSFNICGGNNDLYSNDAAVNTFITVLYPQWTPLNACLAQLTANAGDDQAVTDSDANGSESVTLDGSQSKSPNSTITSYSWTENGSEIATGVTAQVTLNTGTHTITLTVSDNKGKQAADSLTIHINGINHPPVAVNDSYSVDEDMVLTIPAATSVLQNDTDPDNDVLNAVPTPISVIWKGPNGELSLVQLPGYDTFFAPPTPKGHLALNSDGSFTYYPNTLNFNGVEYFAYTAGDPHGGTSSALITITVNPVNDPPIANNDSYSTAHGKPLTVTVSNGILQNDSDPDSDTLTPTLLTLGGVINHGTLNLNSDGSFTYTPDSAFQGHDVYSYKVSDGSAFSQTATIDFNVGGDTPPVTSDDNYSIAMNHTLTINDPGILSNDTDADGDTLTVLSQAGTPQHGQLALSATGGFVYTPDRNFVGTDSFSYEVSDGIYTSLDAITTSNPGYYPGYSTVTITVTNADPIAAPDTYQTLKNSALQIDAAHGVLANDSDPDGNPLSAILNPSTLYGDFSLSADGSFTYTPTTNFAGTASYTYMAYDGAALSSLVTVQINVIDRPPVAVDDAYTLNANTTLNQAAPGVLGNDSDPDGDTFTTRLIAGVAYGTLTLSVDGQFTYTPDHNFSGTDSFTYVDIANAWVTENGPSTSNMATVTFTVVAPQNQSPTVDAGSDAAITLPTNSLSLHGTASDDGLPVGSTLTTTWSGPTGVQFANPNVLTTSATFPAAGSYTLTLTASDGALSSTDTVKITVNPAANQPPIADAGPDQTVTDTNSNGSEPVTLNGSGSHDPDGTVTAYSWSENSRQIATGVNPQVTLAVGSHTISLVVTDNSGAQSNADSVVINVVPPTTNKLPVANAGPDQTVTDSNGDGTEKVKLDGSTSNDPDGRIANYTWTENGGQVATGASPNVTLAVGTHTIQLTVTDNRGATAADSVVITVNPLVNQPPVANAGPDQTVTDSNGDGTEKVKLDGSASNDPDGKITNLTWTENGTQVATGASPNVTLAVGTHTIQLTVTDNRGTPASDSVVITVNPLVNQLPVANAGPDQTVTDSNGDGTEKVKLDGSASNDPDGRIASYVWAENGAQIATGASPNVTLPVGTHTITLTVTDNRGTPTSATVVIIINALVNQPPVASAGPDQTVTNTKGDGTERVKLDGSASSDPDGKIVNYTWTENGTQLATGAKSGVTLPVGTHTITLTVTDNHGAPASATVVITVNPKP